MAPADTLVCDTAQVAAWQSDPAFAYSRELIAPEINVLEWFSRWFGKLLDKIFGNTLVAEYSEVVLIFFFMRLFVIPCMNTRHFLGMVCMTDQNKSAKGNYTHCGR